MGRSKQNKGGSKKEGDRYRKETKEERRVRLQQQEEAREQCMKRLPYVGGAIAVFFLLFGIWVRSVPPPAAEINFIDPLQNQGGTPEFMNVNPEEMVKNALKERGLDVDGVDVKAVVEDIANAEAEVPESENREGETFEL